MMRVFNISFCSHVCAFDCPVFSIREVGQVCVFHGRGVLELLCSRSMKYKTPNPTSPYPLYEDIYCSVMSSVRSAYLWIPMSLHPAQSGESTSISIHNKPPFKIFLLGTINPVSVKSQRKPLRFSSCHVFLFVTDKSGPVSSSFAVFTLLIRFISVNIKSEIRLCT